LVNGHLEAIPLGAPLGVRRADRGLERVGTMDTCRGYGSERDLDLLEFKIRLIGDSAG